MKAYLAGPYSHSEAGVRQARFLLLSNIAGRLMQQGMLVLSPISHSHPIALACELPLGFDYWEAFDRWMIESCDVVIVAMISGWKESSGVRHEIGIARDMGKPVQYLDPDTMRMT